MEDEADDDDNLKDFEIKTFRMITLKAAGE